MPEINFFETFRQSPIGKTVILPLHTITPTQPNDGIPPRARGPIEAFYDSGRILVQNGNHRYYDALKHQIHTKTPTLQVRRVENPYISY